IAYLLTLAALVVIFGRLADMTGRKRLYTLGFGIFIAGSALCGLAPGIGWLIGFRVLQAVGAAMLQANSVAIITAAVPRGELGRAIGIQGAAQAVGLSVGPSVGGFLIATLGWQWVFFIAVPFGIAGTIAAWLVLPRSETSAGLNAHSAERFDWSGAMTFTAAIALLLLALTFGGAWGWSSLALWVCIIGAALALALFVRVERRTAFPLVDIQLLRNRVFATGIVSGLLSYAVLFGALFLLPFLLQRILHRDPASAGLLLTAVPLAIAVLAPYSGLLADRRGARLPTIAGMAMAACSLLLLAMTPDTSIPLVAAFFGLFGAGLGLFTPANNSAIMGSAPPHRLGIAGGVLNMTRSLGTSLGIAATGAILALAATITSGQPVHNTLTLPSRALVAGFRSSLVFLAIVALLAGIISGLRGEAARPRESTAPELVEHQLV